MIPSSARSLMILGTCAWLPLAAACGDASPEIGGGSGDAPPVVTAPADPAKPGTSTPAPGGDTDAPTLVKVSPSAAEKGVRSDATIIFAFSEPMDAAKTEAAYASDSLPAGKVTFSWNASGDTLTITPKAPLAYAAGDELTNALGYEARVGTGAVDRAGNALASAAVASFATLRRITLLAPRVAPLSGSVTSSGNSSPTELVVGDAASGSRYKGLFTFSLGSMPSSFVELETATLAATETGIMGSPDEDLGVLRLQHVIYDGLDLSAFNAEPIDGAAVTYTSAVLATPARRSSTVTALLADDLANRNARQDRTQYRLEYPTATDGDGAPDRFLLDVPSMKLEIVYLAR